MYASIKKQSLKYVIVIKHEYFLSYIQNNNNLWVMKPLWELEFMMNLWNPWEKKIKKIYNTS